MQKVQVMVWEWRTKKIRVSDAYFLSSSGSMTPIALAKNVPLAIKIGEEDWRPIVTEE